MQHVECGTKSTSGAQGVKFAKSKKREAGKFAKSKSGKMGLFSTPVCTIAPNPNHTAHLELTKY